EGSPETDNDTAELKPPLTVVEIVVLPELPWFTLSEVGDADRVKSAATCFHTSEIAVVFAALPAWVSPYKSSSVRSTLKWVMCSLNWPVFTIGPRKMVGIWLLLELSSSSQVTIRRLL